MPENDADQQESWLHSIEAESNAINSRETSAKYLLALGAVVLGSGIVSYIFAGDEQALKSEILIGVGSVSSITGIVAFAHTRQQG